MPILLSNGAVAALAMSARDIAERVEAERQREILLQELSHRVKNALATVQAIAIQTLKRSATPEAFAAAFSPRLMALAQTHDLLTRSEWHGASLRDVIESELAPYQNETSTRWSCAGPAVTLPAETALALGMAFHELATNAAKCGALSNAPGRVEVSWTVHNGNGGLRLHLGWVEAGGPRVEKPGRKGFGTRLIGDGLSSQLDGDVALSFEPAGVRCSIDASLVDPRSRA